MTGKLPNAKVCLWLIPRRIRQSCGRYQNGTINKHSLGKREAGGQLHRHSDLDTCWSLEAKPVVRGILGRDVQKEPREDETSVG